jgi:NDP-sugar pyrophosphorylase family protein
MRVGLGKLMDIRALVLVGGAIEAENIAGMPFGLLDVLGRPVLDRMVERLRSAGISDVRVIACNPPQPLPATPRSVGYAIEWIEQPGLERPLDGLDDHSNFWRAAERSFSQLAYAGAELIVIMRIGAFTEVDFYGLIQFHLDRASKVTAVCGSAGDLLDIFVVNASRRNDAAHLFRSRLTASRVPFSLFPFDGYVNRLSNAADFRRLAVDAFFGSVKLEPIGQEIRPGVWVAPGARIHSKARLLAPAFVGEQAKVRAAAVLTRCAVLERGAEVRPGTIVEDSTLLPYTCVGEKLDVGHSVIGFRVVASLSRNVELTMHDPALVDMAAPAPLRTFKSIAALAGYLPLQLLRGIFSRDGEAVELPGSVDARSASL